MTAAQLVALRQNPPAWLLLRDARPQPLAIFVPDLIRYLELAKAKHGDKTDDHEQPDVDLTALPLQRLAAAPISARATLLAALRKMNRDEVDALYVVSAHSGRVLGIISRDAIERSYRNPKL